MTLSVSSWTDTQRLRLMLRRLIEQRDWFLTALLYLRVPVVLGLCLRFGVNWPSYRDEPVLQGCIIGILTVAVAYLAALFVLRARSFPLFSSVACKAVQITADLFLISAFYLFAKDPKSEIFLLYLFPLLLCAEYFSFRWSFAVLSAILLLVGIVVFVSVQLFTGYPDFWQIRIVLPRGALFSVIALIYLAHRASAVKLDEQVRRERDALLKFAQRLPGERERQALTRRVRSYTNAVERLGQRIEQEARHTDQFLTNGLRSVLAASSLPLDLPEPDSLQRLLQRSADVVQARAGVLFVWRPGDSPEGRLSLRIAFGLTPKETERVHAFQLNQRGPIASAFLSRTEAFFPLRGAKSIQRTDREPPEHALLISRFAAILAVSDEIAGRLPALLILYLDRPDPPTRAQITICRALASHVSLTASNIRLYREATADASEQKARLATLYELAQRLVGEETVDLPFVADKTREILNAETSAVFLLGKDDRLHRSAISGIESEWFADESYGIGEGLTGRCVTPEVEATGRILENQVTTNSDVMTANLIHYRNQLASGKVEHLLAVPLFGQKGALGVLRVVNRLDSDHRIATAGFTDADVDLLFTIACKVGVAIENRRFLREAFDHAKRLLGYLALAGETFVEHSGIRGIYDFIVKSGAGLLSAEDCSLYMVDASASHIDFVASSLLSSSPTCSRRTAIAEGNGAGLIAHAISTGQVLTFADGHFRSHEAWNGSHEDHLAPLRARPCTEMLIVPFKAETGSVMGALKVENRTPEARPFEKFDIELLSMLGQQAAYHLNRLGHIERLNQAAAQRERDRLRDDLHDALNEFHAGVMLEAEIIKDRLTNGLVDEGLDDLERLMRHARFTYGELKNILHDLRDPLLVSDGLVPALERYVTLLGKDLVAFSHSLPERLDPLVESALYRIAQGAVSNAVKHAGVAHTEYGHICLKLEQRPCGLRLRIADNGQGFSTDPLGDVDAWPFGLARMRELADSVGGTIHIRSKPGRGTIVNVRVHADVTNAG